MARYDVNKEPQSLNELEPMILRAQEELSALCQGKKFRMCVPVDDSDSDMVIGDALRHSLAFVRAALGKPVSVDAVDPSVTNTGKPTTREAVSSSFDNRLAADPPAQETPK